MPSGPSALGRREKSTLGSDTKMCMCLERSTNTKKPQITASCSRMNVVSMCMLVLWLKPENAPPMARDANGHHDFP